MLEVIIFSAITLVLLLVVPRLFSSNRSERSSLKETGMIQDSFLRSRVVVSYSIYIVFGVLALAFLLLPTAVLIPLLIKERDALSILGALGILLVNFMLGYLYFLRPLRRRLAK